MTEHNRIRLLDLGLNENSPKRDIEWSITPRDFSVFILFILFLFRVCALQPCGMVITAIRPKPESEKSKSKSKSSKSSSSKSKSSSSSSRSGRGRAYGGRISARERVALDRHTDMFVGRKKEENRPKGKSDSWWVKKYLNVKDGEVRVLGSCFFYVTCSGQPENIATSSRRFWIVSSC